jgi:hypothetical protein
VSTLATAQRAMDTLFDPDGDDFGARARTKPGAPQAAPARAEPVAPARGEPVARARGEPVAPARGEPVAPAPAEPAAADPSRGGAADPARTLPGASGGGPMLDNLIASLWEGLAAHRAVACPVCASEMRPEYGAHALPIGGRCGACGSTLA